MIILICQIPIYLFFLFFFFFFSPLLLLLLSMFSAESTVERHFPSQAVDQRRLNKSFWCFSADVFHLTTLAEASLAQRPREAWFLGSPHFSRYIRSPLHHKYHPRRRAKVTGTAVNTSILVPSHFEHLIPWWCHRACSLPTIGGCPCADSHERRILNLALFVVMPTLVLQLIHYLSGTRRNVRLSPFLWCLNPPGDKSMWFALFPVVD